MNFRVTTIVTLEDDKGKRLLKSEMAEIKIRYADKWTAKNILDQFLSQVWTNIQRMVRLV